MFCFGESCENRLWRIESQFSTRFSILDSLEDQVSSVNLTLSGTVSTCTRVLNLSGTVSTCTRVLVRNFERKPLKGTLISRWGQDPTAFSPLRGSNVDKHM